MINTAGDAVVPALNRYASMRHAIEFLGERTQSRRDVGAAGRGCGRGIKRPEVRRQMRHFGRRRLGDDHCGRWQGETAREFGAAGRGDAMRWPDAALGLERRV
jgi:hypothetical protein